ncbi:MAG: alanine--glyoxylate aminotransferase family protein [Planctomycetota bacterium]
MKKIRLFTPGPTMVPEDLMLEMARPMEHHRTAFFRDMAKEVHGLLQYLFQTKATCLTFTGSGTSAMEAAIVGCCPPGHKALVIENGNFAERWGKVCAAFNIEQTKLPIEWGRGAKVTDVAKVLDADRKIDTVIMVHSETSTAAVSDVAGIAKLTKERGALLLVDGITAVGAIPVKMDEWGVDAYVTGSQKALMLPPGLAYVAVSDRAWQRIDSGTAPTLYNNLKAYRKSLETFDSPYTPNVSLVRGTFVSLKGIKERGLESIWSETSLLAKATRAAIQALGMTVFPADPVDSVTAANVPSGVDEGVLRKTMRGKYGFQIAGGQGKVMGKIIRFSHMGYVDAFDTLGVLAALEMSLREQGYKFTLGAGVLAAQHVFADAMK